MATEPQTELRQRLVRDFASAFVRIRGAHNNADYETEEGEPCAWCRLAAEQAAEAVMTTGILERAGDARVLAVLDRLAGHYPVMESANYGLSTWLSCDCGYDEKRDVGTTWMGHVLALIECAKEQEATHD